MKYYIASHSALTAKVMREKLAELVPEAVCVARWIDDGLEPTSNYTTEQRQKIAELDANDVIDSDIVILEAGPDKYSGGKFVEVGIGMASGAEIIVVGRRENMLLWHPSVIAVQEVEHAALFMKGYALGKA